MLNATFHKPSLANIIISASSSIVSKHNIRIRTYVFLQGTTTKAIDIAIFFFQDELLNR